MKIYEVTLKVDQKWLDALDRFTAEVYDGEVCEWVDVQGEEGE